MNINTKCIRFHVVLPTMAVNSGIPFIRPSKTSLISGSIIITSFLTVKFSISFCILRAASLASAEISVLVNTRLLEFHQTRLRLFSKPKCLRIIITSSPLKSFSNSSTFLLKLSLVYLKGNPFYQTWQNRMFSKYFQPLDYY